MIKLIAALSHRFSERIYNVKREETLSPDIGWQVLLEKIRAALAENKPFLVSRLGWLEAYFIGHYEQNKSLSDALLKKLWDTPGIFPPTDHEFKIFRDEYIKCMAEVDVLGLMQCPYEKYVVKKFMPSAMFAGLGDLEPYYYTTPWTKYLEGKKVLVIHPFAKSIEAQYCSNREKIYNNKEILPEFHLTTILPPQTLCGNADGFSSWSDALKSLKERVNAQSFDVAIIGCGSYGLPIGAFIKKMGKVSVHLGGATQVLFGVRGGRWDSMPFFQKIMNESWVRPLEEERPPNWKNAEDGCYW